MDGQENRLTGRRRAVFGGKRGACKIVNCWVFFFFRCASNYKMADSMFWLELRLIKG